MWTRGRGSSTAMPPPRRAVVNTTANPWCLLPDHGSCSPNAAFCASSWVTGFVLDLLSGAYWACSTISFDLIWLQLHAFILIFGSTYTSLQSKLEKTRTECNRRNMCINCKVMQINPKIESKSFKIPMHMWHLSWPPTDAPPMFNLGNHHGYKCRKT